MSGQSISTAVSSVARESFPSSSFVVAAAIVLVVSLFMPLFGQSYNVAGKHVFITGGSQGLGLALAKLVASKGADVTICARNESKLRRAVVEIWSALSISKQQSIKIAYIAADVSKFDEAAAALAIASGKQGSMKLATSDESENEPTLIERIPDVVFCCAGASKPGFFLEQTQADFESGFKTIYMTALATSHAAANLFVRYGAKKGKIVLTGSTLSLMGLVGYAQYTPMKFAIRGLAETLRSEFQLYPGLSVHAYFPGSILSPGFEEENKTKPAITKQVEGGDGGGQTPEACARGLLQGVERGHFYITTDMQTELFRAATACGGSIPGNIWLWERLLAFVALLALPIWRALDADASIRRTSPAHCKERGFPPRR